ncbi:KilA-N domain-containing protein [Comamonas sp.]|uniref:KilA-N domain-containing protein n=1 Tax=Comamonas sp. TaxID=34028 RepID=UPI003A93B91E
MNSLVYEGHPITIRNDGWFNATEAAKQFDRRPNDWLNLPGTKSYIAALQRALNLATEKSGSKLYTTSSARGSAGTWMHPKLAVAFARWLSDDFAVWCDCQIDNVIRGKQDWKRLRHASVATTKLLHTMIKECREACGKDVAGHHFMTEHKLVNSLLTGKFEGLDRDALNGWQLDLVGHFEVRNSFLMARGHSYDERKVALQAEAAIWKQTNAHRIEAANAESMITVQTA